MERAQRHAAPLHGARPVRPVFRPRRQDRARSICTAGACARSPSTRSATTREKSDPLYKHWPFLLGRDAESGIAYGLYYDTLAPTTFDLGCEYDNYHGFYRYAEIDDGDLDYYLFVGPAAFATSCANSPS